MIEGYSIWDGTSSVSEDEKLDVCWGDQTDIVWSNNPYCWDDVFLVKKILEGAGGDPSQFLPVFHQLEPEEKEQFITLVCKVGGYNKTKETKKKPTPQTITAKQIELTVNEVLKNINIEILKG